MDGVNDGREVGMVAPREERAGGCGSVRRGHRARRHTARVPTSARGQDYTGGDSENLQPLAKVSAIFLTERHHLALRGRLSAELRPLRHQLVTFGQNAVGERAANALNEQ